jgi:ankyrin repeat protein
MEFAMKSVTFLLFWALALASLQVGVVRGMYMATLTKAKYDPDRRDANGKTPLGILIDELTAHPQNPESIYDQIALFIAEHNPNVFKNYKAFDNQPYCCPFEVAIVTKNIRLLSLFRPYFIRQTPLRELYVFHLCIWHKFTAGLEYLLEHSLLYVDHKEGQGDTPLIYAIKNNCPDMAIILIDANADVNICDKNGISPLEWAITLYNTVANDTTECIQALLNHCCNPGGEEVRKMARYRLPADSVVHQLLIDAQRTNFVAFPQDLLHAIIAQYIPEGSNPSSRYRAISPIINTCKYIQESVVNTMEKTSNALRQGKLYLATKAFSHEDITNALWDALLQKKYTLFISLLQQNKQHVNTRSKDGNTFLTYLASYSEPLPLKVLQKLIELGIDINAPSNSVWQEDMVCTSYTLNAAAKKSDCLNAMGIALLRLAHPRGGDKQQLKNAILLLKKAGGTFSTHITYIKDDPFNVLKLSKDYKKPILELIIVNSLITKNLDALELLIQQPNIDLSAQVHGIHTPLTWLCSDRNSTKAHVELLLKYRKKRLNIDEENGDGKTALECIRAMEDTPRSQAIIQLLRSNGASAINDPAYQLPPLHALFEADNTAATPAVGVPVVATIPGAPQQPNPTQAIAGNPDGAPVPGTTPPTINTQYVGSKSIAWLAGLSLCAVTVYGIWKYFHPEEKPEEKDDDEDNEQENTESPVITINGIL